MALDILCPKFHPKIQFVISIYLHLNYSFSMFSMSSTIKGLVSYTLSAYTLAFLVDVSAFYLTAGFRQSSEVTLLTLLVWGFARMYTPTLASIIALKVLGKDVMLELKAFFGRARSLSTLKWYLLSPLMVPAALGIYILASMVFGCFSPEPFIEQVEALQNLLPQQVSPTALLILVTSSIILSSYFAGVTLNAVYALGEEIGWRGFLLNLLLSRFSFLKSGLLVGVLWGFWHATAIILLGHNYQVHRVEGVFLFTLITVLFTFPLMLARLMSKSVLPAASLHGTINALWGFTTLVTRAFDNELFGGLGLLGIISWLIPSSIIIFYMKRVVSRT